MVTGVMATLLSSSRFQGPSADGWRFDRHQRSQGGAATEPGPDLRQLRIGSRVIEDVVAEETRRCRRREAMARLRDLESDHPDLFVADALLHAVRHAVRRGRHPD